MSQQASRSKGSLVSCYPVSVIIWSDDSLLLDSSQTKTHWSCKPHGAANYLETNQSCSDSSWRFVCNPHILVSAHLFTMKDKKHNQCLVLLNVTFFIKMYVWFLFACFILLLSKPPICLHINTVLSVAADSLKWRFGHHVNQDLLSFIIFNLQHKFQLCVL